MSKIGGFFNKLLYGLAEPDIALNPTVRRRLAWHSQTYTLIDKLSGDKVGRYIIY